MTSTVLSPIPLRSAAAAAASSRRRRAKSGSCCCTSSSFLSKNKTKEYRGNRVSTSGSTRTIKRTRMNYNGAGGGGDDDVSFFVIAKQRRRMLKCFRRSSTITITAAAAVAATAELENEDERKKKRKSNKLPTRMVVETAMLAAMTGLSFHLSASFRLETYLGSLFPLPVVVASARWGDVAAWRTLLVAFLLLTLLSGPLRASNYACLHGFTGLALGMCWKRKFSWVQSVPISALARTIGVFSSLAISSLVIRENILRLMIQQVYALIDQICATLGATFVPNMTTILCVAFVFVILNSLSYTLILHLVYSIALVTATPDRNFSNAPLKVRRALGLSSTFIQ